MAGDHYRDTVLRKTFSSWREVVQANRLHTAGHVTYQKKFSNFLQAVLKEGEEGEEEAMGEAVSEVIEMAVQTDVIPPTQGVWCRARRHVVSYITNMLGACIERCPYIRG